MVRGPRNVSLALQTCLSSEFFCVIWSTIYSWFILALCDTRFHTEFFCGIWSSIYSWFILLLWVCINEIYVTTSHSLVAPHGFLPLPAVQYSHYHCFQLAAYEASFIVGSYLLFTIHASMHSSFVSLVPIRCFSLLPVISYSHFVFFCFVFTSIPFQCCKQSNNVYPCHCVASSPTIVHCVGNISTNMFQGTSLFIRFSSKEGFLTCPKRCCLTNLNIFNNNWVIPN